MKKVLIALAIAAFGCTTADAQVCKAKKKTVKRTVARTTPRQVSTTVKTQSCRAVPYEVCQINADRHSVTCYKTMDLDGLTPINGTLTHFGPNGAMPNQPMQHSVPTTVINGEKRGDYCRRDEANGATVCSYNGKTLMRDANGQYHYRTLPQEGTLYDMAEPGVTNNGNTTTGENGSVTLR